MMYEDVVADFAMRTRHNLRALESLRATGQDVFEVTQLINSMLGLLIFPREDFVTSIPKIPIDALKKEGWPVPKMRPGFAPAPDLAELVRYLRNAISHFNVEFIGDGQNEIRIVRVWNKDRTGTKTWEADLGLDELRGIAERFADLLLERPYPMHG
jgi:HEPN pEK499 p136